MADLRCPMCGKPNLPHFEICQYCQARLKPLIAPPSSEDRDPGNLDKSDDLFPADDGALPDWLDDLRSDKEPPTEDQEQEREGEESEIWSSEREQRFSSAFTYSPEEDNASDEDWLARLTGEQENKAEETEPVEEPPEEKPVSGAFLDMEGTDAEEETSDWLAEFPTSSLGLDDSTVSSSKDESQGEEQPAEGEKPHWLELIRTQQQKESERAALIPDQRDDGLQSDEAWVGEPGEQASQSDWLSDIGIEEGEGALTVDAKDLPDWLAESINLQPERHPQAEQEQPEWMPESELPEQGPLPEAGKGLPDWLAAVTAAGTQETIASSQDVPDWLSNIAKQEGDQSGLPEPVQSKEGDNFSAEEAGVLPDWLTKLESSATEQSSESSVPALILDDHEESLAQTGSEQYEPGSEKDITAVPDWLNQFTLQEEQAEETTAAEAEPDVSAAQLPSWLQAMRPVETAAPSTPVVEEKAKLVEKVGPLAGLAGVLPAEPEFAHLSKPKSSLVKLQVSDNQQTHITLLENLLAEEGQAKPISARPTITSQYFLRLLIAAIVFVAVLVPLWLNRQLLPLPDPAGVSPEIIGFSQAIAGLPSGAPVLVAFDYEPGYSGELEAIAAAAVAEVAERGARLVVISTNPIGPILAERFIAARLPSLGSGSINLGYIPGGATGLLAFAQAPRDVSPFDLRGGRVWENTHLASASSLADFAMVMVITENPDTARSWIEQVQPSLGQAGKPMLMVLSAQAEPMVRPYYEASPRQIDGMISGLAGGAALESISGTTGVSRLYWDAFGIGLILAAALMLLGGIASLILALISKPDKSEVEGAL